MYNSSPQPLEKIIAALSYLTVGAVGFIWIILAVFTHNELRPFLRYHVYQSIFLSILYFLVSTFINLVLGLLSFIPFVKNIVGNIAFFFSVPLFAHFSIISFLLLAVMVYLLYGVLKGRFSYIPWVSDVINYNVRR